MRASLLDRLLAKVTEDENGCWIFSGATTNGYGVIGLGSRSEGTRQTHRVAYELFVGQVPDGLHLDHLCMVRRCCNPDHLEPVTQAENNRRMKAANRATACRRGHPFTPENTRHTPRQRVCRTCVREWNRANRSTSA